MGQPGHIGPAEESSAGVPSLVFRAGPTLCALRLEEIIETMRPLAVKVLAGAPEFVRGVCIMRGVPTPVVDVARLLGGEQAEISRFVAVRSEHGPLAFATGPVLGIRAIRAGSGHDPAGAARYHALLGGASQRLVVGLATLDAEPLLLVQSMRVVPDEVWATAAGAAVPS